MKWHPPTYDEIVKHIDELGITKVNSAGLSMRAVFEMYPYPCENEEHARYNVGMTSILTARNIYHPPHVKGFEEDDLEKYDLDENGHYLITPFGKFDRDYIDFTYGFLKYFDWPEEGPVIMTRKDGFIAIGNMLRIFFIAKLGKPVFDILGPV